MGLSNRATNLTILRLQQRLDAYEAKSDINEDQRRALAGRGTIDAVVKELNELLLILQVRVEFCSSPAMNNIKN